MKLCWDNIENIRLSKYGNFRDIVKGKYYYLKICNQCKQEYLGYKNSEYCSKPCIHIGKKHSKETKQKISKLGSGKNASGWKGGYYSNNIPSFDTFAPQLKWCEKVRRNKKDSNILEVKCFKCGKWFVPNRNNTKHRVQSINGKRNGENRFYCSDECKNTCSIYHKRVETIIRDDAIRAGRLTWIELEKEVQGQLRQLVLERDNNECQKCGATENIQCHHIYPVNIEPLFSADINNCITLCKECHKEAHTKDGCNYSQLHMEEC